MAKEILIYGFIGQDWWTNEGNTAKDIISQLKAIEDSGEKDVTIRINSPGGQVHEGTAIYNAIAASKLNITTQVDGIAYSMGAIIALAGNKITMMKNSTMMIHNVSGGVWGNANDLKGQVQMMEAMDTALATTVADKTGLSVDEAKAKYFNFIDHTVTAQQALDDKLIDSIIDGKQTAEGSFKTVAEAMNYFHTAAQKQFITAQIKAEISGIYASAPLDDLKPEFTPTLN